MIKFWKIILCSFYFLTIHNKWSYYNALDLKSMYRWTSYLQVLQCVCLLLLNLALSAAVPVAKPAFFLVETKDSQASGQTGASADYSNAEGPILTTRSNLFMLY